MQPKSIGARSQELRKHAEEMAAGLSLREFEELGNLGRYFLRRRARPLGGFQWAEVVVLRNGHLLVHGDCDAVIFGACYPHDTPRSVLYWMASAGDDYAEEKAHIGSSGKVATEWDPEVALWYLDEYEREEMLTKEQAAELRECLRDEDLSQGEFARRVYEVTDDCELCSMGHVMADEVFMARGILRKLCYELEQIDFRKNASAWFRRAA